MEPPNGNIKSSFVGGADSCDHSFAEYQMISLNPELSMSDGGDKWSSKRPDDFGFSPCQNSNGNACVAQSGEGSPSSPDDFSHHRVSTRCSSHQPLSECRIPACLKTDAEREDEQTLDDCERKTVDRMLSVDGNEFEMCVDSPSPEMINPDNRDLSVQFGHQEKTFCGDDSRQTDDARLHDVGDVAKTDRKKRVSQLLVSSSEVGIAEEEKRHILLPSFPLAPPKPSVIVLGRGNSFSLGRSEVLLLHSNRKRNAKASSGKAADLSDLLEKGEAVASGRTSVSRQGGPTLGTHSEYVQPSSPADTLVSSPPPVSINGSSVVSRQSPPRALPDLSEMERLWQRVEGIMAAKKESVMAVLDSYGIGEPGCRGEDEEECRQGALEEESVWDVVQDYVQV